MAISEGRGFEYGVFHVKPDHSALLIDCVCTELDLDSSKVQELLDFGAVYLNQDRIFKNQEVSAKDLIRIHKTPRRFDVENIDWQARIVSEETDFLVINKPRGIPCHSSVDNFYENVLQQLQKKMRSSLFITNRLDVPTGGLLVLAKSKTFQSEFNNLLTDKKVRKFYKAIVPGNCNLQGLITHYMEPTPTAPKKLSFEPKHGFLKCQLEVTNSYFDQENNQTELYIDLITGRTHQIRAQLAEMSFPILGDTQYDGIFDEKNKISLWCTQLKFKEYEFELS